MAAIPSNQARGIFTQMVVDLYRERPIVQSFLRSFFTNKEESTRYVSIEVQRGTEKVAVDVLRGTEGNRNMFSKSTEKIFEPPLFREFFDATQLDLYDSLFGRTSIDSGVFGSFMEQVAEKLGLLQDKIERAYELQCAQVFETGIVTVANGTNIDFKRKAGSLVPNGAGNTWATGTVDPFGTLEAGCNFLRQVGKSQGGTYNAILGSTALTNFLNNTIVKERAGIRNFFLDNVRAPQRNSVGASLHGQVSCGSYNVNLWTYPEFYDNSSSVSTPYINPKKVIILPEAPKFTMAFAAVPQLVDESNPMPTKGAFRISDFRDERKTTHEYDIQSAGIAIPTAVDQIYTVQPVA